VKGGTGKTTTAANIAIERARRGSRVILVDADPDQESLTDYIANRDTKGHTPSIPVVQAKGTSTSKSLLALARDYTDVVVDCGGFDSVELRQSILVAQAWIIPLNPTQMQVWTMPKLAEILAGANALRGETPLVGHLLAGC
jgi:chromosome partitioning protein